MFFKRLFDITISILVLCMVCPFAVLFVWLGNIIFDNSGPLFFTQVRTGHNHAPFVIYKFRSMVLNNEADTRQATDSDPRITRFGKFLRISFLDELPQFYNVLKGDMSIIGPRPHMLYHTEVYSKLIPDYGHRHAMRPGITGWAQVCGCWGETKTVDDMAIRVSHDLWYIDHWSLWLDMKIFLKSIMIVFRCVLPSRGAKSA